MNSDISKLLSLDNDAKIKVITQLWDSMVENESSFITDEHQLNLVQDRLEKYEANPTNIRTWEEFKRVLLDNKNEI